jgi:Mg/Co/Ni transporter MgtE
MPALFWVKGAMFGAATAAWWFGGDPFIGAIFGTLAAINLLTAAALRHV